MSTLEPTAYELENCTDLKPITHPAFFMGEKELYLFFKDEQDELYFLKRSENEPDDLFDIGAVIDADEAIPVQADSRAEELAIKFLE
ncbi:hypothetical protein [Scatolibacter rhodanostii]|uniref:hypothetical protein n=1 Tax=Scatolibacter rhodanostii TaxID=2014781 RepID=UPI000C083405|nr:hypothetical protein [Scatolibacter rhodanostii]